MSKAARKARLLALAKEQAAKKPKPKSAQELALETVSRKLTLDRFKGMFRSYAAAIGYVRDELGVDVSTVDLQPTEGNWDAIYRASLAVEAERFTDPTLLAPPDRPRKTRQQSIEERQWEREQQRIAQEDQHYTSNIGPTKYGSAY
jgi:hypothetical protein